MILLQSLNLALFLTLVSSADGGAPQTSEPLNQTGPGMPQVSRRDAPTLPPPFLRLPVFVDSRLPLVETERFSPERGTGLEPVPEPVRGVLFPARPGSSGPPGASAGSVRTECGPRKLRVRVERGLLGAGGPQAQLRLGTCRASKSTEDYLYFEYDLDRCGTKRTMSNNQLAYSNTLLYDLPRLQGPIRRAVPFTLPVACYYNRYQYSYKIGYTSKMQMRKIFKPVKNRAKFILTPRNAQWGRLSPSDQYMLGKPMYFEAEAPSMSQGERLYIHSCFVTSEKSHTSTPQFQVVKNFGCMVESKDSHSLFIPYKNNGVRFTVDAFLFKGKTSQELYMHCSMSVGSSVPTPTAKFCNYNTKEKRWVELYGSDSVCTCCDSNCSSAVSTGGKIISSRPWTVEPKVKLTTAQKRKTVSSTTITTTTAAATTTTTAAAASQSETAREVIEWRTNLQHEVMGKAENTADDLEWLFGGGGVTWVEAEGGEKSVKGSAVVEEVEVTAPHTIFEEIFDLDK